MSQRISIIDVSIDTTSYEDTCDRIANIAQQVNIAQQANLAQQDLACYIVAANVHVIMTAYWNQAYRQVLANAEIVTPDGMPLVWGLRSLGIKNQQRVYGPDLMLALCDRAVKEHLSIYLFGATGTTLDKLEQNLKAKFSKLAIAGKHAPPYMEICSPEFDSQITDDVQLISKSGAKLVFVALGCPKQEFWMSKAQTQLPAVMIGVGAAFDFHSGQIQQAPRWMMENGLEWLYRFSKEPKRLWQRYLINNPCFVILFAMQHLRRVLGDKPKN